MGVNKATTTAMVTETIPARDFRKFADRLYAQFKAMSEGHELYVTTVTPDEVWDTYLSSFPEGTNPMFRARTEHDGSYDRHTLKRIGNVVRITQDGELMSVWDEQYEYPYNVVAEAIREKIKTAKIDRIFRTKERSFGYIQTTEIINDKPHFWYHFHVDINKYHQSLDVDKVNGEYKTKAHVFGRGLAEIKLSALDEMIELIEANGIYRGQEFLEVARVFRLLKRGYDALTSNRDRNIYIWKNLTSTAALFRNTLIGTLALEISMTGDLSESVKAFERRVAPANYKRPTALITEGMVKTALKTIQDLDLEPSLERRHAKLSDVSINNVLWVANSAKSKMKEGVAALLDGAVAKKSKVYTSEDISIEDFLDKVTPKATSMEVFFGGNLKKNLVSITAPVYENTTKLFKWDNDFAWSYNGEITDAIKERVKKAGGNIQADLRISLAWNCTDDLDLHCHCPYGHVYFGDKKNILDVDMNVRGESRTPVENLAFMKPKDGIYRVSVNQFRKRHEGDPGLTLEVECKGVINRYHYEGTLRQDSTMQAFIITMKGGEIKSIDAVSEKLTTAEAAEDIWGIKTQDYIPVNTVMLSPNYWDNKMIGNKHWFFILDKCANPEPTRGIYNEFLRSDLEQHRKVFEILGSKTKCQPTDEQLSGLGFSSTIRESLNVRVTGPTINKSYNIAF